MAVETFTPRAVTLPGDLAALCRQYLAHLSARGYADNTVRAYRRDLEQLVGYLAGRDLTLVQTVTTPHLDGFVDALICGEGNAPRTAARKLEGVKGLFRFAASRGLLTAENNPCNGLTPIRFQAERKVAPELERLLAMVDAMPDGTALGIRDKAIFRLMLDSSLRVSGLLGMDVYTSDAPPRYTVRPSGVVTYRAKGGRTEESLCDDETLALLDRWLAVRPQFERDDSPPALFLSERGTRPTRQAIHALMKKYGAAAGMPQLHAHLLRHARIGDAVERGDLHLANYLAGHKQMSTTANIYGAQSRERLRARLAQTCPVRRVA